MKTEHLGTNNSDPIWASNVELLPSEECLPVIGSCQVTSILQNLDNTNNDHNLQNMDLIILNGNDYKIPLEVPLNLHSNNYIVLKEGSLLENGNTSSTGSTNGNIKIHITPEKNSNCLENNGFKHHLASPEKSHDESKSMEPTDLSLNITETSNSSHTSSISPKHYDRESFEDMLYFVCNLCPFLCTKETKITEHLEGVHKNKTLSKLVQLKCPACANIFYHRASLKSHLLHDHCVASGDLNLIVQAVVFYSNKENKKEECTKNELKVPINSKNKTPPKSTEQYFGSSCSNLVTISNINKVEFADSVKSKEKEVVKVMRTVEKVIDVESSSETSENFEIPNPLKTQVHFLPEKIPLPQVDITPNNSEKLITTLMKKTTDPMAKYNMRKCVFSTCKVTLAESKSMDYHIESHLDDGFKCLECHEKFLLWKPLTSHLWRLHKVDMELFSCDKCDYKTNSLSKLNTIHKLIHSNVKAYQCDTCHKSFKNQKQLRNHRRIHRQNVEKQVITCELCSKGFTDKRRLRNHMDSVHKKLKPFLCNYCGYKGSCKASLRMHIRSHTGEKPYACDECSYTSADHNSLRRHKLRHSGQKPYRCSYCSYACIQSSTYKVHLRTKHPGMEKDLMFTCFMCQFRTVNKDMYNSHLVTVHKQKPADIGTTGFFSFTRMEWAGIALEATKVVSNLLLGPNKSEENPNYRIRGHFQGKPLDCTIEKYSGETVPISQLPSNPTATSTTASKFCQNGNMKKTSVTRK